MLSGIALQTADLKWLVPMIVGSLALLGCLIALFVRGGSWTLIVIAGLSVALIGASVFTKISVNKDGFIIETAQLSAQVLADLEKASKANADAISQLTTRVDQLAAVTQQISEAQPSAAERAPALNQINQSAQKVQEALKLNNAALKNVGMNNALLQQRIGAAIAATQVP
jgi:hypothetical protein